MKQFIYRAVLVCGLAGFAQGNPPCLSVGQGCGGPVPEIDPSLAASAVAVVTGAGLLIRSRRKE